MKKRYILLAFLGFIVWSLIYSSDPETNLGKGYRYNCDVHAIFTPINVKVEPDIPPYVLNYNYNRRYIIVKQNLYGCFVNDDFFPYDYNYPDLTSDYYWIIDKSNHSIYGPMKLEEYSAKRDSLKIKLSFNPKDEKKPRPIH